MAEPSNVLESQWYFNADQLQNSPSRKCGIDADKELQYRQQTAYLIQEMGQYLRVYVPRAPATFFSAFQPHPASSGKQQPDLLGTRILGIHLGYVV